jgi:hypothetical protein
MIIKRLKLNYMNELSKELQGNEANTLLATVLSKSEAIKAMREGKKVTHQYFTQDEWVQLTPSGLYQFEDGVICPSLLFWQDRKGEQWETGWSLYGG